MKKEIIIEFIFLLFYFQGLPQFVTIEGRQFKDENGNDFNPVVCNYQVEVVSTDPNDFSTTFVSPRHEMGAGIGYECHCNNPPCNDQLTDDFKYLISMGFNTIRVMGIQPLYIPNEFKHTINNCIEWHCTDPGFYVLTSNCLDCQKIKWNKLDFPYTTGKAQILFSRILELLTTVSQAEYNGKKLKVILITGGAWGDYSEDFPAEYAIYLAAFAQFIHSQPIAIQQTILAYDLFNEPSSSMGKLWPYDETETGHSKQDVCNNCKLWYNAIKDIDTHLITLGGSGMNDVFEYDPGVLTLDFYSYHIYPLKRDYEYNNQTYLTQIINRVKGSYYWLQKNSPMPWIIGETGFRTQNVGQSPVPPIPKYLDGTLQDQSDYLTATLYGVWQCGGSGYSWWDYQGDYFGILNQNQTITPQPTNPCHPEAKPAHHLIETFVAPAIGTCDKPDYYYDPFDHVGYSNNENIITGTVTETGNTQHPGIEDAFLLAETKLCDTLDTEGKTVHVWNVHYTFTNETGKYTLIPFDYDIRKPNYNHIEEIRVSAVGSSRKFVTGYFPWFMGLTQDFQFDKYSFKFDDIVSNKTINPPTPVIFQAWNSLSLYDINIESQAEVDFKARHEINVFPEFHSKVGSKTWIHTTETYTDCSLLNLPDQKTIRASEENSYHNESISKELELTFKLEKNKLTVYPNPTNGIININIDDLFCGENYDLIIIDQYGRQMINFTQNNQSFQLDLSSFSKGVYYLLIKSTKNFSNAKIVHI